MVETTISNFREGFSLIAPKLHRVRAWNFTHKAFQIWLIFWYKNLHMFEKIGGDEAVDRNKQM